MEHEAHAELLEHFRHEIELPIDTPPDRISTSCVRRWKSRRSLISRFVVAHVIVGHAREAVLAQAAVMP